MHPDELALLQERMIELQRAADELQASLPPARCEIVGVIDDTALFRTTGETPSKESASGAVA